MKNKIKILLRESLLIKLNESDNHGDIFYHGNQRNILNWDKRDERVDMNMLGFGIYLTSDKLEAVNYAKDGYIFAFKPINANILDWGSEVPKDLINNIKTDSNFFDAFEDGYVENEPIFYNLEREDEIAKEDVFKTVGHLYTYLYVKFNSTKKATQYLVNFGVDGVKFKIDTSDYEGQWETPTVVVIYNPKNFKLVSRDKVKEEDKFDVDRKFKKTKIDIRGLKNAISKLSDRPPRNIDFEFQDIHDPDIWELNMDIFVDEIMLHIHVYKEDDYFVMANFDEPFTYEAVSNSNPNTVDEVLTFIKDVIIEVKEEKTYYD